MLIIIAHRLLIGTAICFGVFYTAWEALAYRRTHEASHLVIAVHLRGDHPRDGVLPEEPPPVRPPR